MKLGLVGLPNSGKTTIFNALTKSQAEVNAYSNAKAEPNVAIVEVGDDRVRKLSEMYQPKKTTFATIEIVDFVGMAAGSAKEGTFSPELLNLIKTMDALAFVIRNFESDLEEKNDPLGDIQSMTDEMMLLDLIFTETRLERIAYQFTRGKKTNELVFEQKVLERIRDALEQGQPVRSINLDKDEQKVIRGYQYLTQKPFLVILNSAEENFGKNEALLTEIRKSHDVIEFAGRFEMELSQLSEEDAEMFMEDMGIRESARDRLTRFVYQMLGYISFFTVGKDEVRAWTIHDGDTALEAAAAIHSDLARGFIRAECFHYEDLIAAGSEKAIRGNGKFRLEGKDYRVKDGDILSIRFAV
ncbi:MAG: redox-regulated ATPase YchF [Calditrichaeota bacterium]|nr:redox-regulated ATPase YchF [Calditrichota bacterium]